MGGGSGAGGGRGRMQTRVVLLWALAAAGSGCGGGAAFDQEPVARSGAGGSSSSAAAATAASSGFGGSGGGGGEPSGAYLVHFVGGAGCNVQSHQGTLGSVTAATHGAVVANGTDGAQVTCSVAGTGPFKVSASITQGDNALSIEVGSLPATATKKDPATGGATFASSTTTGKTFSVASTDPNACTFYFIAPESIAPGKVWLAFACTSLSNDTQDTCQAYESYVLLENCQPAAL